MTTNGTRVRVPEETDGRIGVRQAARKYAIYGVSLTTIHNWMKRREVVVTKEPAFPGDTMPPGRADPGLARPEGRDERVAAPPPHHRQAQGWPQDAPTPGDGHGPVGGIDAPPTGVI